MNGDTSEMTMRDYWRVLSRRRLVMLIAILAVVLPAAALSLLQEPVYEATSSMLVRSLPGDSIFGNDNARNVNPERAVQNEIQVLESEVVAQQVKEDLGLTTDPPEVEGSGVGDSDVIEATVRSGDSTTAQLLANAYANAYISVKRSQAIESLVAAGTELQTKVTELEQRIDDLDAQIATASDIDRASLEDQRRVLIDQQALFKQRLDQLQVDTALSTGNAQIVASAEEPVEPVEPTPLRTVALAIVVGLLLAVGAAFLLDYLDDSIRTPEQLAELVGKKPVLAVVPVDPPIDHWPIALSKPDDLAVESYRTLRTNVQFLGFDGSMQVIQVTSGVPGEGKTTTASNLAVVLAQAGNNVVIVDGDLRRPRLHEVFGVDGIRGLTSVLMSDQEQLHLRKIDDQLAVVPAGPTPPNPSEMLSGRRMAEVVRRLKERFDFVIIDSAPVLPVSDAVALSRHVDGVLVVAQAGRTSAPQLAQTLASLEQVSAPVIGMVLNRAANGSGSGYGYGYGYRYTRQSAAPVPTVKGPGAASAPSAPAARGSCGGAGADHLTFFIRADTAGRGW